MDPIWNPRQVLGLNPLDYNRCAGFAPSQGRECRNFVGIEWRTEANSVLREMCRISPDNEQIPNMVEDVAENLLCRRYHGIPGKHCQIARTKSKWMSKINHYIQQHYQEPLHLPTPPATPEAAPGPAPVPQQAAPPPPIAAVIAAPPPPMAAANAAPVPEEAAPPPHMAAANTDEVLPGMSFLCNRRHQHARRRPLPADCLIHHDTLDRNERMFWCKSQCGQNFCRECIHHARSILPPHGVFLCPYCRHPWDDRSCACDDEIPLVIEEEGEVHEILVMETEELEQHDVPEELEEPDEPQEPHEPLANAHDPEMDEVQAGFPPASVISDSDLGEVSDFEVQEDADDDDEEGREEEGEGEKEEEEEEVIEETPLQPVVNTGLEPSSGEEGYNDDVSGDNVENNTDGIRNGCGHLGILPDQIRDTPNGRMFILVAPGILQEITATQIPLIQCEYQPLQVAYPIIQHNYGPTSVNHNSTSVQTTETAEHTTPGRRGTCNCLLSPVQRLWNHVRQSWSPWIG